MCVEGVCVCGWVGVEGGNKYVWKEGLVKSEM